MTLRAGWRNERTRPLRFFRHLHLAAALDCGAGGDRAGDSAVAAVKAPFPWFGGKSTVSDLVWSAFGDVRNYVEPFFGSGAVLLGRPEGFSGPETVNDRDAYLANFWRALQHDPEGTAKWADWPVNEVDLLARHRWLVSSGAERLEALRADPASFDARVAGYWVWGLCAWIGSGWCRQRGDGDQPKQLPHLGSAGMGINRKLPHLGDAGRGERIADYFTSLAQRLRDVRVACGEWDRVLGESVTFKHGLTGIFLDPPYDAGEHDVQYSANSNVSAAVCEWAIANGNNQLMRIALCGYTEEHTLPESWACVPWKARGGYGSQSDGRGRDNADRERIWFSPHCIKPQNLVGLFDGLESAS